MIEPDSERIVPFNSRTGAWSRQRSDSQQGHGTEETAKRMWVWSTSTSRRFVGGCGLVTEEGRQGRTYLPVR